MMAGTDKLFRLHSDAEQKALLSPMAMCYCDVSRFDSSRQAGAERHRRSRLARSAQCPQMKALIHHYHFARPAVRLMPNDGGSPLEPRENDRGARLPFRVTVSAS